GGDGIYSDAARRELDGEVDRQRFERALRDTDGRVLRQVAVRAGAEQVDDGAAVRHVLDRFLGDEPRPEHIHIERVTQVLRQRIDGRTRPFEATRGAVHDDIDAAEALGDGAYHRLHSVSVTDVRLEDLRGDALASHFRRSSLRMIGVAGVVDRDRSAIGREADGNRLADAARAAGDEGYLAVKQFLQSHPFRWSCMP